MRVYYDSSCRLTGSHRVTPRNSAVEDAFVCSFPPARLPWLVSIQEGYRCKRGSGQAMNTLSRIWLFSYTVLSYTMILHMFLMDGTSHSLNTIPFSII